jgi:hypothetical protein
MVRFNDARFGLLVLDAVIDRAAPARSTLANFVVVALGAGAHACEHQARCGIARLGIVDRLDANAKLYRSAMLAQSTDCAAFATLFWLCLG